MNVKPWTLAIPLQRASFSNPPPPFLFIYFLKKKIKKKTRFQFVFLSFLFFSFLFFSFLFFPGMCLLFYGPSGTGKTMTANAIGTMFNKKLLLVNLSVMSDSMELKEYLRLVFREAKIQNACLFFDECESLFESRSNRISPVGIMLTQIENYDDIVILATNRHFDLDEVFFSFLFFSFLFFSFLFFSFLFFSFLFFSFLFFFFSCLVLSCLVLSCLC